jgi:ribonuclease HI
VEIVTDSEYVMKGITQWIHGWKRNGWKTKGKTAVANQDLWIVLDRLAAKHQVSWSWTRGHASHADNNRADELATTAAATQTVSAGWKPDVELPSYELKPAPKDASAALFESTS